MMWGDCMTYRCHNRPDWPIESVGDGAERLTGYEPDQLVGSSYRRLIVEADRQRVWEGVQEAIRADQPFFLTYRITTAGGEEKWVYERGQALDQGCLGGSIYDLQDFHRNEERLQTIESIIRGSPAVVFRWRNAPGWPIELVTDNVEELFGYSSADFTSGQVPYSRVVHPDDLERVAAEVKEHSETPERRIFSQQYRIRTREGEVRWLEDRTHILRDAAGQITHYQGIVWDDTRRVEVETRLRRQEERYRLLAENILDVIWRMDLEMRFTYVNQAVQNLLGLAPEALIGTSMAQLLEPGELQRLSALIQQKLVEEGDPGTVVETRLKAADGEYVEVEIHGTILYDGDGGPVGIQGVTRDIRQRRRAEQREAQLLQNEKMLSLGRLAGGVAHDFNNLLAVVLGNVDCLRHEGEFSDEAEQMLLEVQHAAERARDLTANLLTYSRNAPLETRVVDLNAVLEQFRRLLKHLLEENIEVRLETTPEPALVQADAGQLEQLLMNLVVNARDAMPDGGCLRLTTERTQPEADGAGPLPEQFILLTVTDNGCGMDPSIQSKIFEPFFTTKEVGQGTGLGLATVYAIVEQHGGRIEVESHPGDGCTFRVFLPAASPPAESTQPEKPVVAVPQEKKVASDQPEILVIEDEPSVRSLIRRVLSGKGYQITEAQDGEQALARAREHQRPFDLVVSDVVMPKMPGPEVVLQLRQIHPQTRVLFISGYTGGALQRSGLSSKERLLAKPFTVASLLEAVEEILQEAPLSDA